MKNTWKKIRRGIKYPVMVFFIRFFMAVVRFFPRLWVNAVFAFFARIAFRIVKKERERTIRTLTLIYEKEKTAREIKQMGQEVFVNQALNFSDYIYSLGWKTRE